MKILTTAALLALVPVALVAAEQGEGKHGNHLLKRWDSNGDKVITREEAQAAAAENVGERFDSMDANKDGTITQDELDQLREQRRTAMKERMEQRFKDADKNSDGALSKEEAQASMPRLVRHYDSVDQDKNGLVTTEELKAHHQSMHGKKGNHR